MGNTFTFSLPEKGNQYFGDVDYKQMHGQPAVGFFRWRIILTLVVNKQEQSNPPRILTDLIGDLYLTQISQGELLCGSFHLSDQRTRYIGQWSSGAEHFVIETEIDARRLVAIEELRQGKKLNFRMRLNAFVTERDSYKRYPTEAEIQFSANQSDWLDVLSGMQFRNSMLLEVPMPEESRDPELAKAAEHVANASGHMSRGYFRNAVAECRDALECIKTKLADLNGAPDNQKELSKEQRISKLNAALINVTHLAHHSDERSKQTEWLPEDAQFILIMTGAILRMVTSRNSAL